MIALGELRVEATLENLRTISYFVHGIGRRLQLTEKTLFDLELALEEACANIVKHAYPVDYKGDMVIKFEVEGDVMRITLIDWGLPLNPDDVTPFDINAPIETRIKGGMGLHFIRSLTDSVERHATSALGEPNTLILTKLVERLQPGAHQPSTLRELNAMLSISQIMVSNIDLDDLLERIIEELVATIDAERGTLYLVDNETGELCSRILPQNEQTPSEIRLKMGEGVAGYVAATGRILNIRDAYSDPRFNQAFDSMTGYRSSTILAAPMINHRQKTIGVVQLLNKKGGTFSSRDERLLTAMAAQAAVSIENARLYAQEMKQQLLNQELETARAIQKSFLPQTMPQIEGWDISAFWYPMYEVGGDFYDFFNLPDGRMAVIIGDVSGKSVPAALVMAYSVTLLRFAMRLNLSPAELLNHVNQIITTDQKSRMFATVFVGFVDFKTGVMTFASAGHNPPLIYRATTRRCEYLNAPGVALGVFPEATYSGDTIHIEAGDALVLYTDGITEVINEAEEEFGEERLENVLALNSTATSEEMVELILKAADTFAQKMGGFDDETLMVIKRR